MILKKINMENDIKRIPREDYDSLAAEIREFLIDKISRTGGHLASNLGVVELTMAMHIVFDLPKDKIVWDVGHQSYTHKLLTGRRDDFETLRCYGGMSGFPKRRESECDSFDTGHSSTSISAGLGIVRGNEILNKDGMVISVIGDGALTGGMAYEALNNAAQLKRNFIIILNDNNMSISENVGGISRYLDKLRVDKSYNDFKDEIENTLNRVPMVGESLVRQLKKTKSSLKQLLIPGMFFEDMGITYLGPVDGHNVNQLISIMKEAKKLNQPVLIHVLTKKGKGYLPAERHPDVFHGVGPFDKETGKLKKKKEKPDYTDVFSLALVKEAEKNKKIVAITAAMPDGTGLKRFKESFPERFFDVGIAEGHAVTFAAGLASTGLKPFVAIYSSFLQRGFDQIIHDVCIQNLPVIFAVDRAGLVGSDGETHHGVFDISYMNLIPNLNIMAPKNKYELAASIQFASEFNAPLAIRYPRGEAFDGLKEYRLPIEFGKCEVIYKERGIAILAVGSMVETAIEVREILKKKGLYVSLVNARFIKPFDEAAIMELSKDHDYLITMEENVLNGGFGQSVLGYAASVGLDMEVINIALPNGYIEHGNVDTLKKAGNIDAASIVKKIEIKIGIENGNDII
ncbi:1-deoxy-D-xylulose-5-phosphate synthase [Parasporobacterium paucivorans]|uniref:1-deoxy-D-xylulose-5-phosphate synthase n=1 Tax=Parasporobacterium paucivorans DSM 15970 TaxID=1122934 RepID=A0A1M6FAW9_9FIRM|nr:1-deoxy-D-xylulose-5-phosphate synthase [Parasporobacterium paucivorans]SHI94796.1 1-deoxy-D-xylulose-5-phosphate synthase [Parasporobacterium paucivorans DSM 15970]